MGASSHNAWTSVGAIRAFVGSCSRLWLSEKNQLHIIGPCAWPDYVEGCPDIGPCFRRRHKRIYPTVGQKKGSAKRWVIQSWRRKFWTDRRVQILNSFENYNSNLILNILKWFGRKTSSQYGSENTRRRPQIPQRRPDFTQICAQKYPKFPQCRPSVVYFRTIVGILLGRRCVNLNGSMSITKF